MQRFREDACRRHARTMENAFPQELVYVGRVTVLIRGLTAALNEEWNLAKVRVYICILSRGCLNASALQVGDDEEVQRLTRFVLSVLTASRSNFVCVCAGVDALRGRSYRHAGATNQETRERAVAPGSRSSYLVLFSFTTDCVPHPDAGVTFFCLFYRVSVSRELLQSTYFLGPRIDVT